jgi:hypothetical protein
MTDNEFDEAFIGLNDYDILQWLGKNIKDLELHNGAGYFINNLEDLKAVVYQEEYQRLTGRE